MHLTEAIRQAFPNVRSVSLVPSADGTRVAIAVMAGDLSSRVPIAEALVRRAAVEGFVAYPVVYDEKEWVRVQAAGGGSGCEATFTSDGAAIAAALAARAGGGAAQDRVRDAAVDMVRSYRRTLDAIADAQSELPHVTLGLAAHLVRRGLEILYACRQLTYTVDGASVAGFDAHFSTVPPFNPGHAVLYHRLVGCTRQAEQAYWLTGKDDAARFAGAATVDEARAFLQAVEEHIRSALTTDAERTRALRRRRFLYALVGPALLLFAFVQHRLDHPDAPMADVSAITGPGFITGEYFAGEDFERKVFDRNDNQIAVTADEGSPAPELAADHFSVRWNGYMMYDQPGKWHLCAKADDRVRIFFNNRAVVDDWRPSEQRTVCGTVHVERGWYPLRVEYADASGPAALTLLRGAPRRGLEPAPPWVLCCSKPGARPPESPPPTLAPPAP